MFAGSATNLGIFAYFMAVQTQLDSIGTPWYVSLVRTPPIYPREV